MLQRHNKLKRKRRGYKIISFISSNKAKIKRSGIGLLVYSSDSKSYKNNVGRVKHQSIITKRRWTIQHVLRSHPLHQCFMLWVYIIIYRVCNEWNLLTEDVVSSGSLNTFEARLDHHLRNVKRFIKALCAFPLYCHPRAALAGRMANSKWYWGGNLTTTDEFSRFQRLFPNPSWLVWGWSFHSATKNSLQHAHGLTTAWWWQNRIFSRWEPYCVLTSAAEGWLSTLCCWEAPVHTLD